MDLKFRIIPKKDINDVIPLVYTLNEGRISKEILKERFTEMITLPATMLVNL